MLSIIFTEKIWTREVGFGLVDYEGIGFITLGILSLTGAISLPSDSMSGGSRSGGGGGDTDMMMSMDMSSSSPDID